VPNKGPRLLQVPEGDNRQRLICPECDYIAYENPRVVAGSVVTRGDQILICKRSIYPRKGLWTLPAGFLELGESPEEGARREAKEEVCAEIAINEMLAVYSIPSVGQIQFMFRATLESDFEAGHETLEAKLVNFDEIPWNDIAFPSVTWALRQYYDSKDRKDFPPFGNPDGQVGEFDEIGKWP
jgi:ADP-ribose pyrophosphatase YjhB (NUDIX family)